jgi:hypothetical protein
MAMRYMDAVTPALVAMPYLVLAVLACVGSRR